MWLEKLFLSDFHLFCGWFKISQLNNQVSTGAYVDPPAWSVHIVRGNFFLKLKNAKNVHARNLLVETNPLVKVSVPKPNSLRAVFRKLVWTKSRIFVHYRTVVSVSFSVLISGLLMDILTGLSIKLSIVWKRLTSIYYLLSPHFTTSSGVLAPTAQAFALRCPSLCNRCQRTL